MEDWDSLIETLTTEDFKKARENGIYHNLAFHRFYYLGWTKERTINDPPHKSLWKQFQEVCEARGISKDCFYQRINKSKLTPEQACLYPPTKGGRRKLGTV